MNKLISLLLTILIFSVCQAQKMQLVDSQATKETKALYQNLLKNRGKGCLFGHQDDMAYGVLQKPKQGFSDVFDVAGDYPALYGWDLSRRNDSMNIDSVSFEMMKIWIKQAYARGGVNTISVHMSNPLDKSKFQSANGTQAVKAILPNGEKHEDFKHQLDLIANFVADLKGANGEAIPIIFRPWHEHNGDWFWWGKRSCTEEEYIQLWQFTVKYLRDVKQIHNFIYAFSPDRSRMEINKNEYLYGYPGDEYVDILGLDDYRDVGRSKENRESQAKNFAESLQLIVKIAEEKGKIAALTETGDGGLTIEKWYTKVLLKPFLSNSYLKNIAYVMVWRNARKDHHYTPYKGHPEELDFLRFKANEFIWFEKEVYNLYGEK